MTRPATPQEGPTDAPPALPEGWLAQWEGQSRKYYYVQRATGHSQWDVPTQPALSVPTPDPTPQNQMDPFQKPQSSERGNGGQGDNYEGADRGFLSDLAMNAAGGKQNKPQNQSGLGGLASSFLGGQGSHGGGGGGGHGHGNSGGGLASQFVGSLLGGGSKPHDQQPSHQSSGGHGQGGLMGLASGFLGGHHGASGQGNNYGYSSTGQSSGNYSGEAPPVAYNPSGSSSGQYGSSAGHGQPSSHITQHSTAPSTQGYAGTDYGQVHPNTSGPTAYGQPATSYESFGQQHHTIGGQSNTSFDSPHQQTPYGQQTPYQAQHQASGYDQYPAHGQQGQYPPPPNNTPAHPAQSQGGYTPYGQQPSIGSYPGQQGHDQGQYPGQPSGGYPGQSSYGAPSGQGYGQQQPQHGGYGQQGSYNSGGAPPAPGWRA